MQSQVALWRMIKHLIHQHRKVSLHLSNHNHKYLEILVFFLEIYNYVIYITELPSLPGSDDELEKVKRNLAIDLDEATIVILDTDDECVNPIKW